MLTGMLIFFLPGSASQIVIAMFITAFFLIISIETVPFLEKSDYNVFYFSQWWVRFGGLAGHVGRAQAPVVSPQPLVPYPTLPHPTLSGIRYSPSSLRFFYFAKWMKRMVTAKTVSA